MAAGINAQALEVANMVTVLEDREQAAVCQQALHATLAYE